MKISYLNGNTKTLKNSKQNLHNMHKLCESYRLFWRHSLTPLGYVSHWGWTLFRFMLVLAFFSHKNEKGEKNVGPFPVSSEENFPSARHVLAQINKDSRFKGTLKITKANRRIMRIKFDNKIFNCASNQLTTKLQGNNYCLC